jgi:hypothetical protein
MPYIGKTPTVGNFQVCDAISVVNGQAAYTLQVGGTNVAPESANHMLVSLNGILQKPGSSFTISGSTMTFASNLATGDVIDFVQILGNVLDLGTPSDDTVSTAKIVDNAVTSAKLFSSFKNGITMIDQFRLSASISGANHVINANWERPDTGISAQFGSIQMSQSSGVFTFPSTGFYKIDFIALISYGNVADNQTVIKTQITTDNSSYSDYAEALAGSNSSSGNSRFSVSSSVIVDITDTSNQKCQFTGSSFESSNVVIEGNTGINQTVATFTRIGDT